MPAQILIGQIICSSSKSIPIDRLGKGAIPMASFSFIRETSLSFRLNLTGQINCSSNRILPITRLGKTITPRAAFLPATQANLRVPQQHLQGRVDCSLLMKLSFAIQLNSRIILQSSLADIPIAGECTIFGTLGTAGTIFLSGLIANTIVITGSLGIFQIVVLAGSINNVSILTASLNVVHRLAGTIVNNCILSEFVILQGPQQNNISIFLSNNASNQFLLTLNNIITITPSNYGVTDNNWHHVCMTWASSTGEKRLYVDGVERYFVLSAQGTIIPPNGSIYIAQDQQFLDRVVDARTAYPGSMDEVRVYNRVLTPFEISQRARGQSVNSNGMVLWWNFDDRGTKVAPDYSYTGNTGKLSNSIVITDTPVNVGQVTTVTNLIGNYQYNTKAKSLGGQSLLLQRMARYGNIGGAFDSHKGSDDSYLYRGNVTNSIADWVRELSDTLGYDWRFDANGNMVLLARNNPSRFSKFVSGTRQFSPSALNGNYQLLSTGFSESNTVNGERIDVVVGRSPNTGIVNYRVDSLSGLTVSSGQISTGLVSVPTAGIFIYDNNFDTLGNNLCINTIFEGQWGTYTVVLSGIGGGVWWLDSILSWDRNSNHTRLPAPLQTDIMIEQLNTQSLAQEAVNDVIVVGAIKSTLTDTQKAEKINNPDFEFYVSRAVDPSSIWDSNATNYIGGKISSVLIDKKISNQDYANWAAQTLLFRQRDPGPSVRLTHPVIPFIEPRDRLSLIDKGFQTIVGIDPVWVQTFTETYESSSAISELVLTSYEQIASYDPNQSLSVDQIDAFFFGQPIINFKVTYPSIDNGIITNPGANLADARLWGNPTRSYLQQYSNDFTSYTTDSQGDYINLSASTIWPPIFDSITLGLPSGSVANIPGSPQIAIYKNNPYMKFAHIFDYTQQRVYVPCLAGDGGAAYTKSGTGFNLLTGHISYLGVDSAVLPVVYSGICPFYDPYMSELPDGQLISISFDTLTTGYYRVSVWNARNRSSPTLVSWLTEPTANDPDPESHWTYFTAQRGLTFQWDGVDNIGNWNDQQSGDYAWRARGWFEKDQKPNIGAGFYVWNDQTSDIVVISNQKTNGKLTFNPDHFAQFFVKVECKNDDFAARALVINASTDIRVTDSDNLQGVAQGQNAKNQIYIYTHLPQPTTIQMAAIEDWNFKDFGSFNPISDQFGSVGWVSSGDYAASIRNDKPVRITYQAIPRPGNRFQNNRAYTSFKLHNSIHLNIGILDSFMMFMGQTWNLKTNIEMKRLVNRRLLDDKNTLVLADADWRTGDTLDLPNGKWVFRPQDLTVIHDGITESIRYCDYLQITDIPGFSQDRTIGQPWSRLIIAYLAYLFYLSTYIQDRSGRMTWAIDPAFTDKTKILKNTFATTHPEQLDEYAIRTIIARQWVDTNYATNLATTWSIPTLVSGQAPSNFIQFFHQRLDVDDNVATDPLTINSIGAPINGTLYTGLPDYYSDYIRNGEIHNRLQPKGPGNQPSTHLYRLDRALGAWNSSTNNPINYLGLWTWEGDYTPGAAQQYNSQTDPLWIPDLTRDFHPFFLIPPNPYELSRIPFWTSHTLPLYGPANIYDNYDRYAYGQGTMDTSKAASDFEVWMAVSFPTNDTRTYNDDTFSFGPVGGPHSPHRTFLNIGVDVAHFVDFTLPDNSDLRNKHAIFNTQFDYTRQQEWRFWENYRGIVTIGSSAGSNNTVYVTPTNPYLMNSRRYDLIVRSSRGPWQNDADSLSITGIPNSIDSTLGNSLAYLYVTQVRPYGSSGQDRGWFTWTFRREYNWYSSSYFPVSNEFKLHPRYLYPKYNPFSMGQPPIFDTGAWVGWKDDNLASEGFTWRDSIQEPFNVLDIGTALKFKNPFAGQVNSSPNDNIFVKGTPRMPIGQCPRFAESTDVMITLSLVNSRRKNPVTGISP